MVVDPDCPSQKQSRPVIAMIGSEEYRRIKRKCGRDGGPSKVTRMMASACDCLCMPLDFIQDIIVREL